MAIVALFDISGMTAEKYDEAIRRLTDIGERVSDGQIIHICYGDTENLQVINVFENQAKLQAFAGKLMPILAEVGIEAKPPTISEVYNIIEG